jgi:hypothetical protein
MELGTGAWHIVVAPLQLLEVSGGNRLKREHWDTRKWSDILRNVSERAACGCAGSDRQCGVQSWGTEVWMPGPAPMLRELSSQGC